MDSVGNYLRLMLLNDDVSNLNCIKKSNFVRDQQLLHLLDEKVIRNEIVPRVNVKLHGNLRERSKGLNLLRKLIPQCPLDILTDQALSWMQQCLKWDASSTLEELKILSLLFVKSAASPDLRKLVISSLLLQFSEKLINHRSDMCHQTIKLKLKCLKIITDSYSSSCGPYRSDFNKFVLFCLKQYPESKKIVRAAARCFVSLCQCCGKGQLGVNQKELWSSQFKALIDTSNKVIDSIYGCVDFLVLQPKVESTLAIPALLELCQDEHSDPVIRFHRLNVAFSVLSEVLQTMLLDRFPVSLSFQPADVFALVRRVLSVNGNTLRKCSETNDTLCLNAVLPDVHSSALDILIALIRCGQRECILISYGHSICKLCLQLLKWTSRSEWKYGASIPFESLRCKAYDVLSCWLLASGSDSLIETVVDELIPIIILNFEYQKPEIQLITSTKPTKNRKRKMNQNIDNSNTQLRCQPLVTEKPVNKNVCITAHRLLQLLIHYAGNLIKWEYHKMLQYSVIPLLMDIIHSNSVADYLLPYSDADCRLELFKTLHALTEWPHFKWKMPLSLAVQIFSAGTKDSNPQVSSFCSIARNQYEPKMHPRGPTLALGIMDDEGRTVDQFAFAPVRNNLAQMYGNKPEIEVPAANRIKDHTNFVESSCKNLKADASIVSVESNVNAAESISEEPKTDVQTTEFAEQQTDSPIATPMEDDPNAAETVSKKRRIDVPVEKFVKLKTDALIATSVEDNPNTAETISKKPRIEVQAVKFVEDDPDVSAMLSDFVDTLE